MIWECDDLWSKAAVCYQRAFQEERESDLFPFWACLGLELLARSAVAKVHPALLADPQQPENILFAFGYPSAKPPRSVMAKTVFHRLQVIVPDFTKDDFKFCTSLMELRNAEMHSGELPFDGYPTDRWLPRFLRITKILADFTSRDLETLLGPEEAAVAERVIETLGQSELKSTKERIAVAAREFHALADKAQSARKRQAKEGVLSLTDWKAKPVGCPACEADAVLDGEVIRYLEDRATDEGIEERAVMLPVGLRCECCGLSLSSHAEVFHAGLGEQYTTTTIADPKDYYGIEFDPGDYLGEEYMNE